jgi:hypothetical protein
VKYSGSRCLDFAIQQHRTAGGRFPTTMLPFWPFRPSGV